MTSGMTDGMWSRTQQKTQRSLLVRAMKKTGMNKNRAARLLGIDPRYIRRLLKKFGL